MQLEAYILKQLEVTYQRIQADQDSSSKIRNWCITVWIGALVLISGEKVQLGALQKTILPFLPIVFFWFLDALQHVFIFVHRDNARRLERLLMELDPPSTDQALVASLEHGIRAVAYSKKLRMFARNLFAIESVVFFYAALLLATTILTFM